MGWGVQSKEKCFRQTRKELLSQVGASAYAKAWRSQSLVRLENTPGRGGEHDGHPRRVWGSGNEEGFSREQAWQVLEATLCLQSSEEQLGSKWSTAAISRRRELSRGRELCSAP